MTDPTRALSFEALPERPAPQTVDPEAPSTPTVAREWLVTNGLGGYSAGTVSGVITRRFHGVLVAALPAPRGRTMMLNHLSERVHAGGAIVELGAQPHPQRDDGVALAHLAELRLERGLPVWRYEHGDLVIEKRVVMPHRQNTVLVTYTLLSGSGSPTLELEPWIHFRPHEGPLEAPLDRSYSVRIVGDRYEIACEGEPDLPPLRLLLHGGAGRFEIDGSSVQSVRYAIEASRGYDAIGTFYTPGRFLAPLAIGEARTLVASTEEWHIALALSPAEAIRAESARRARLIEAAHPSLRTGSGAELVLAADQFLISPAGRAEDTARAHAHGDEVRTVIAGYHWFTDWGRDTMISLEGLTLATGRWAEAGYILRTFAHYVRDGLIPNMFPEGSSAGLYHTADATLWFFHALDRYVEITGDRATLAMLMPTLRDIVAHHLRGTRFGIGVDPADGLLRQGAEGYQLTWMDAKVGDLVVTPRRGKAVEINALWYNALRSLERWSREAGDAAGARTLAEHAERAQRSFAARFWYAEGGWLYDVVDGEHGDDPALRPNQILAISLPSPVLDRARWEPVLRAVEERLLTPVGLRSLAPGHPDYKARYFGDLRARDLAYHQGTVWAWLIGPFVDAFLKVRPERAPEARRLLDGLTSHLDRACVGTLSEIFDAEEPYVPRACCAQAWSVAEVLRCLVKTASPR